MATTAGSTAANHCPPHRSTTPRAAPRRCSSCMATRTRSPPQSKHGRSPIEPGARRANPVVYVELPGAQHSFDLFCSIRFEAVIGGIEAFATSITAPDDTVVPEVYVDSPRGCTESFAVPPVCSGPVTRPGLAAPSYSIEDVAPKPPPGRPPSRGRCSARVREHAWWLRTLDRYGPVLVSE